MRLLLVWLVGTTLLVVSFVFALILGLAWSIGSAIGSAVEACMVFAAVVWLFWDITRKVGRK